MGALASEGGSIPSAPTMEEEKKLTFYAMSLEYKKSRWERNKKEREAKREQRIAKLMNKCRKEGTIL